MSNFLDRIKQRAKQDIQTIVLPEGNDPRTIAAAETVLKENLAKVIILGDKAQIEQLAAGHDIAGATIIQPECDPHFDEFADKFYQMRKDKGMDLETAKNTLKNTLYFGVMMVKEGLADGMVAGAANSTPDVLRPALQILKTAPGTKLVSAFFVMCVPNCEYGHNGTFIYADSGLNGNPNAQELCEIAISSAASFETLVQATPNVAMLSYSTYGSAKSELVDKVATATKMAKEKAPHINLDGEMQLDAAIVPEIGESKANGSPVAGHANVLIFPDLNAGNIGYKLTERLAKAQAYGPVTQGIAKPVNDLSRGCSAEDIVGVVAITAVQAIGQNK